MRKTQVEYQIGDCLEVLKGYPDDHFDSCVTDPPYGLAFMGKHWDKVQVYPFTLEWAREVYRVLKPGAHLLAFGGTRTWHRLACGIEDIGFEYRDTLLWLYGSGFPKSHDVSKAIDKYLGNERKVVGQVQHDFRCKDAKGVAIVGSVRGDFSKQFDENGYRVSEVTEPGCLESSQWNGWGTALKPAWEPIVLARKPLKGTVAENVLEYGTGGINVDGCRISLEGMEEHQTPAKSGLGKHGIYAESTIEEITGKDLVRYTSKGRWPSNVVLDEEAARMLDEQSGELQGAGNIKDAKEAKGTSIFGIGEFDHNPNYHSNEGGGASRFFYIAKASREERERGLFGKVPCAKCGGLTSRTHLNDKGQEVDCIRNPHPTVKPIDLMAYLTKLVTPKDGICLDPFLGSGTTLLALRLEGLSGVGIEKDAQYAPIIKGRLEYVPPPLESFENGRVAAQVEE